MADFDYACIPISGNVYRACRSAVLRPLLRKVEGETVGDRYERLLRSWRVRASALTTHGWHCGVGNGFQYLRNCPPFGIRKTIESVKANRCKRTRICPWCYSKTVVATAYQSIERTMYRTPRVRSDVWLCAVRRSWTWWPEDVSPADVFDAAIRHRRDDLHKINTTGTFTLVRIAPCDAGIELVRSTIYIIPKGSEPKFRGDPEVRQLRKVKKESMADLVGWACRYPPGLMYGDPALMVQILDEARKRRFRSHFRTGDLYWDGVEKGQTFVED
jgi:hypothetical protein